MKTDDLAEGCHVFDNNEIEPRCVKCGLRIRFDDFALHDAFERIGNGDIAKPDKQFELPFSERPTAGEYRHSTQTEEQNMTRRTLTFPWRNVKNALNEFRSATEFRTLYGVETGPGFWLVGDEGVYLMPNLQVHKPTVVYAFECDPTKLSFEEWWASKEDTFGADDGVEFVPLASIDNCLAKFTGKPRALTIHLTEGHFSFGLI